MFANPPFSPLNYFSGRHVDDWRIESCKGAASVGYLDVKGKKERYFFAIAHTDSCSPADPAFPRIQCQRLISAAASTLARHVLSNTHHGHSRRAVIAGRLSETDASLP